MYKTNNEVSFVVFSDSIHLLGKAKTHPWSDLSCA